LQPTFVIALLKKSSETKQKNKHKLSKVRFDAPMLWIIPAISKWWTGKKLLELGRM